MSEMNLENMEQTGRKLYKNNSNYRNLATIMEHPEFRKMVDEYFQSWNYAKTFILFMKLYEKIEKESHITLSGYQKLTVIDNVLRDQNLRQKILHEMNLFTNEQTTLETMPETKQLTN